jgi:hypothetical protein
MAGFIMVAETALILLAVLTDVSGFSALMASDTRVLRREVGSRNEPGSKLCKLLIPSHTVYG